MKVVLVVYTPNPEELCAKAMRSCRTAEAMHKFNLDKPAEYYIALASQTGHLSVLEHASFTFSVEGISRACSHQLVRHRLASYSQQSQRAVKIDTESNWYILPESIRNCGEIAAFEEYDQLMEQIAIFYQRLLKAKVSEEDARFVLPNACKTNIVVTMNARELLHFFELRLDKSAQWEIRRLAELMLQEVQKVAPNIFKEVETK